MTAHYDEATNPSNGWRAPAAEATDLFDMPDDLDFQNVATPAARVLYTEVCSKCRGSGRYDAPSSHGQHCFQCGGEGKLHFKLSASDRAKKREAAERHKAKKQRTKREEWLASNPAAVKVFADFAADSFVQSLKEALDKWGSLTSGQLVALLRKPNQEAERAAQQQRWAEERAAKAVTAPVVDVSRIEAAFASARDSGLAWPKLFLGGFKFKPAKAGGANSGGIYVVGVRTEAYFGKVLGGKFIRGRDCDDATAEKILAVLADPYAAAVAYGKLTGNCSCCSRPLTNKLSVELGIGPICRDKYGWGGA